MRLPYDLAFDLEHLSGLRGLFMEPQPIRQSAERGSLFQNGLRQFKLPMTCYCIVLPWRAFYETSQFLARASRLIRRIWSAYFVPPKAAGDASARSPGTRHPANTSSEGS